MALKFITEESFKTLAKDKKVLARFDFNVPMDKKDGAVIADTTRIDEAIPTIKAILEAGAKKVILMSHFGRPKGKVDMQYSLEPVAKCLAEKLGMEVTLTETALDRGIKTLLGLNESKIILLQNLRFHPEEEGNDREFARQLSTYGDVFVFDAFGAAHRKHASTYEINAFFKNKAYGGLLLKREVESLDRIVKDPKKPFVAVVGGAKVSDKIKIIEALLISVDKLLIGGAMAYPFLKAQGHTVGKSLCSDEDVTLAKRILGMPSKNKIVLPSDHLCSLTFGGEPVDVGQTNIEGDLIGLDIGPSTIVNYNDYLRNAKTVLWNGPMGLFENKAYAKGTLGIAKTLSELKDAFTLVGGGDSVNAVNQSGLASKMSHISTGGGASLEYIENGTLPGIQALKFGID
ncbi:phosphoglycerate kinase [Bacteriovorax stolpii]|uniref:Phosphoglycerate kinase n=1 Tax=Bacteriovorax stolpii TaxID=960 RepID=A0A2K9NND8_BACTC|nr:phosphoglycerate kinase [Bacteriovorax stolpii]AUN97017.1 phosphoglycerate kinase [Bacteriovorax stolpii]QDK43053.1 phosphoglycerate kinase [Bacteriovorax stolpii]TDP53303.1 phosphoglycerate kinase [Bacteriovorax stolpii]